MSSVVEVKNLSKSFPGGLQALNTVNLTINQGEILALLGPNGAGKTTLISIICGICLATSGEVLVNGHDIITHYRDTRKLIGLVPQDVSLEPFETCSTRCGFRGDCMVSPEMTTILKSCSSNSRSGTNATQKWLNFRAV